jgi:Cu-Zn family superoxide dismutase
LDFLKKRGIIMNKVYRNIQLGILIFVSVLFIFSVADTIFAGGGDKVSKAVAVLSPTRGNNVRGTVTFTQAGDVVTVEAEIEDLSKGKHGFHIHEFGDCSDPDGKSAGGHYNPTGQHHAGPDQKKRHVGDMGNIEADSSGKAQYDAVDSHLTLNGPNTIIGRGVIVHAGEDDLKSQPSGAAGPRVACGVIGVANP